MFVTKKRYNLKTTLLNREIASLEGELDSANREINRLAKECREAHAALTFIAAQRTSSANATVTRMADKADEALGNNDKAVFIEDEQAPTGTLADIRRAIEGKLAGNNMPFTLMPVGNPTDVRTTFDWTGLDTSADAASED